MNMGYERKKMRGILRKEPLKLGFLLLLGCLLVLMALVGMSRHCAVPFPKLNFLVPIHAASSGLLAGDNIVSQQRGNLLTEHAGEPLCDFSGIRSNICEMKGGIKIHGNSSSIIFITSSPKIYESYHIKPHARKQDEYALTHVKELSVKSVSANDDTPKCTMKHNIPAIVFSTGGYMGNMFHDFTDVLIPLFITSHQFFGEVQFLISEYQPWWIRKYQPLLRRLSRYEIIDLNKENEVHCYNEVIVGLKFHKEMSIDPSRTPNGYSMVDFANLMRRSFALQRESTVNLHENHDKRPRLLIISRKRTRTFMNIDEVVQMASKLNYEVLVEEAGLNSNLGNFSQVVNTCDVLMGVHGAGLTNLVFLPANAVVIQVVPLGGLESIAYEDFGVPSLDMKLRYLQYSISEQESSLIEQYPRDHAVFKDPATIKKQGWLALRSTYLINQNVKLDVGRFRGVLLQALDLLHKQIE